MITTASEEFEVGKYRVTWSRDGRNDDWVETDKYPHDKVTLNKYYYTHFRNYTFSLKYPTKNNCNREVKLKTMTNGNCQTDGTSYGYVDYVAKYKPYVIKRETLVANPNWVIPETEVTDGNSSGFWGQNEDSATWKIAQTLMHEHCTPCISPDDSVVSTELAGNIIIWIDKAQGGQNSSTPYKIPVYIEKRNCQAYQSTSWKKSGNLWKKN